MFDYLQKYNNLPKEVRDKVSSPEIISVIEILEKKYGFSLAGTIMQIVIKDIKINDLVKYFAENFKLDEEKSRLLAEDLKKKVFKDLVDYLGLKKIVSENLNISKPQFKAKPPKMEIEKKSETSKRESSFYFSEEDEKEIKELTKKIGGYSESSSLDNNIEETLDEIISKIKINFGSQLLSDRFRKILKIYLKGVRDRLETKQTLAKSLDSGGLGFDAESVEKVLLIADGNKSKEIELKIIQPSRIKIPEDEIKNEKLAVSTESKQAEDLKKAGIRDIDYDLNSLKKAKKQLNKLDTSHELAPPPPTIQQTRQESRRTKLAPPKPKKKPKFLNSLFNKKEDVKDEIPQTAVSASAQPASPTASLSLGGSLGGRDEQKTETIDVKTTVAFRKPHQANGKIKMDDIKFEPKIMGPIDELRYMNLINFRRLDDDPLKAAEKIKEKIHILEEYSKKMEGIKAWRLSPANGLYLKMGEASISKKKPIDVIIKERKSSGKDYLNPQEFEAIIKLNKSLRF